MSDIEYMYESSLFDKCLETGKTRKQILLEYRGREGGQYYLNKFANNLFFNCGMTLKEYLIKYFVSEWPKCNIKNTDLNFKITGAGIKINKYSRGGITRGNCEKFDKFCNEIKVKRLGENNPMYGKKPWNKGLKKDNNISLKTVSNKLKNKVISIETRQKMSDSAKKRKLHGHTGKKHSDETKAILREKTAKGSIIVT